jgi:hypothetical protein
MTEAMESDEVRTDWQGIAQGTNRYVGVCRLVLLMPVLVPVLGPVLVPVLGPVLGQVLVKSG